MSVLPIELCPVLVLAAPLGLASVHSSEAVADVQEDDIEFHLFKCKNLQKPDQYQWQLTDRHALSNTQLCVFYQGEGNNVQLHDQGGNLLGSVDLCRSAYYTVIKFSWNNKTYRYLMLHDRSFVACCFASSYSCEYKGPSSTC